MATDSPQPGPTEKPEEQSSRVQLWLIVLAVLALVVGLIVYSYVDWPGSGYMGVADKKIWDYLDLLIVPAALAIGVYWLNRTQDERNRQADAARERERQAQEAYREYEREATEAARSERDRKAQTAQRDRELEVESQRAQDEALQAYLDQIGQLLLGKDRPLRQSKEGDEVRTLARARTLTVLPQLDGDRKGSVLQFLYESGLLDKDAPLISLKGADLRRVNLPFSADLQKVSLQEANLQGADLSGADLTGADLIGADLRGADLSFAFLEGSMLNSAQLGGADLSYAALQEATFSGAKLGEEKHRLSKNDLRTGVRIRLEGANLENAHDITNEELAQQARSLEGATMPNGQKYEDWLKDKEG